MPDALDDVAAPSRQDWDALASEEAAPSRSEWENLAGAETLASLTPPTPKAPQDLAGVIAQPPSPIEPPLFPDVQGGAPQPSGFEAQEHPQSAMAGLAPPPPPQAPVPPPFQPPLSFDAEGNPVWQTPEEREREARFGTISEPPLGSENLLEPLRTTPLGRLVAGGTEAERAAGVPEAAHPSFMETVGPLLPFGFKRGSIASMATTMGFLAEFAANTPDAWNAFRTALKSGDRDEAKRIAIEYGFGAAFSVLMALGLHGEALDVAVSEARARFRHTPSVEAEPPPPAPERKGLPPAGEGPTPEGPITPEVLPPEGPRPPQLPPIPEGTPPEVAAFINALNNGGRVTTGDAYKAGALVTDLTHLDVLAKTQAENRAKLKAAIEGMDLAGMARWQLPVQLPREAIEAAMNFGSAEGAIKNPPLDWRKNPEVAKWILAHAQQFGWDHTAEAAVDEVKASLKPAEKAPEIQAAGSEFGEVSTPAGTDKVKGNYDVAEAGALITSNQPGYDQALQPRDRTRQATIEQVNTIANQLNPARLSESHTSDLGAPFVNTANNVLSGNARVMALRLHYDRGHDLYRHWLLSHAQDYGLDPAKIEAMDAPVLIRRVTDYGKLTPQEFARLSNEQQVAGMGEGEQARADAMWLESNPKILDLFNPSEAGDLMAASNRSFLNAFVNGVGGKESLLTADGFNEEAVTRRVKNALLAVVLGPEQTKTIATLVEGSDTLHIANRVDGVLRSVPRLLKLRGTQYDQTVHLGQALRDLIALRRSGQTVEDFLASKGLFGNDGRTAESDAILFMLAKAKSAKAVTEALMRYAQMAEHAIADIQAGGLFGGKVQTPAEIWRIINEGKKGPIQTNLPPAKPPTQPPEAPKPPGGAPVQGPKPPPAPAPSPPSPAPKPGEFNVGDKVWVGQPPMHREGTLVAQGPRGGWFVKTNLGEVFYELKDIRPFDEEPPTAPAAPPPAPPQEPPPPGGKPLIGKERADEIRKRLKKKLDQKPPPPEEKDLADEEEISRQQAIKKRLEEALARAHPDDLKVVQPMLDELKRMEARIRELEGRTLESKEEEPQPTGADLTAIDALLEKTTAEGEQEIVQRQIEAYLKDFLTNDEWEKLNAPQLAVKFEAYRKDHPAEWDEQFKSNLFTAEESALLTKVYGESQKIVEAHVAASRERQAAAPKFESLYAMEDRAKLDATIFSDAVQLGSYYIQNGLHRFEPWAAQMREDFGAAIEPYLKSVYETARRTIEAPTGQRGGGTPGLQPGLLPPDARIVHARGDQTAKADESLLPAETVKFLDPHQRQGAATNIAAMERNLRGALNADGTGVGKTREGLTVALYWAKKGFKVLYITKAEAIKPNWKKNTFGGSLKHDSGVMGITIKLAKDGRVAPGEIGVTTYENAKSVEHVSDAQTVLIWDESHALKNNSQRGRAGDRANHKAHAVLFMSATPADKPEHIYYLQRIGVMEGKTTAEQLRDLGMVEIEVPYVDPKTGERKTHKVWAPNQNISKEERDNRFASLFDRLTERGAMIKREISMKGVEVQVLKVALPPEAHDLQQEILRFFDAETVEDLKGIKKAIALMHMRRQQEPFKIASTVMLAQRELEAGRQVMIFVSRVNESEVGKWVKVAGPGGITEKVRQVLMSSEGTAKSLRDAFHEAGIHDIAEIHGEADQPGLEALADFNAGKKRVCIATIESGGTGINADDTAGNRPRTMIVVTAPFDAVGNVQAAGRIWRLKTLSGAYIYYLFADTDVDDWNADIIGSKMATLGAVVKGQVRRLDVTNPDWVTTDDFGTAMGGKGKAPAPLGPSGMPKLDWKPYTTKKGESIFAAPATGQFWQWYKTEGGATKLKAMGAWVGRGADGKLSVFARTISDQGPAAEPPTQDIEEARHGTATGLPPGVPDGGPGFAAELLEASRRLGTLVVTRTTLPAGVLGRYIPARAAIARDDAIEVGDIDNQATVAHEMGHDVDALLFPTIFVQSNHRHSQQSLAERIGLPNSQKKAVFEELVKVSELMRGPIAGSSPAHQRYRRRATELIADFFSLYVHDVERARQMAPIWSHGLELALSTQPDAAETVRQLLGRNVTPIPGNAPPSTPPRTGGAAGMPGAVPARQAATPTRELAAAAAAESLVEGTIRRYKAEVERARIVAENWRLDVPNYADRNDVGAFVEGIGNLEVPGDTIADVQARMTPNKRELAKQYRFRTERLRNQINRFLQDYTDGEYLKFLEDYIPHFYVNSRTPAGQQALAKFIKNSPNAKQRRIPNLREAVEAGLIPISQDPTVLFEIHAGINWRVATNRRFVALVRHIADSNGGPTVVPAGNNPGGWPVSDNPLIRIVYARQTPGGVMLWQGGAAFHPDLWHAVRQILEVPIRSDLARLYDAVNAITRANAFAFSFFHDITLRSASVAAQAGTGLNPLRGLFRLFEKDPATGDLKIFQSARSAGKGLLRVEDAVVDAALHGLVFSFTDSEAYQHAARDVLEKLAVRLRGVPFLGTSARLARDLQHWRQEALWRNTHDAFKILAYHELVSKALAGAPRAGGVPSCVKKQIASLLNDAFGGQEWQTKFWMSPQVRLAMSRFWLAPDWTLSTLRSVPFVSDVASEVRSQSGRGTGRGPGPQRKEGWQGNIGRARFWTAELAALALATIAAQYAIWRAFGRKDKGDQPWVWDNEFGQNRRFDVTPIMRLLPWHNPDDPTRYYVNLGKRPEEILHWFIHPEQNIQSKLARPLIEAVRQLVGVEGDFPMPWKRDHDTFLESLPERSKSAGREFVPFVFGGNQFALSLPYRKGMTKYKAGQAFEEAYQLVAQPSLIREELRGHFSGNMQDLLNQIRDAAAANGVNVEAEEKRARSIVRGKYYGIYFRAYQKGDQAAMERATDALDRLGASPQNLEQTIKRREALEPALR